MHTCILGSSYFCALSPAWSERKTKLVSQLIFPTVLYGRLGLVVTFMWIFSSLGLFLVTFYCMYRYKPLDLAAKNVFTSLYWTSPPHLWSLGFIHLGLPYSLSQAGLPMGLLLLFLVAYITGMHCKRNIHSLLTVHLDHNNVHFKILACTGCAKKTWWHI